MKFFIVAILSLPVWCGQSIHLPHGKHGTVSNPPFLNSDEFRIEFRMKNRTLATGAYVTGLSIPGIAEFRLQRGDTGNDVICYHVPTNLFRRITVSTSMDFEIRMQYKVTTPGVAGVLTCEGWDIGVAGVPSLITATQSISVVPDGEASATTITLGPNCTTACGSPAGSTFDMAYLRIFLNAEVPDNSLPPAASLVKGNLYNYEFDGTTTTELGAGTNTSGAPRNLTWDGDVTDCPSVGGTAPCVLPTPANAPVCDIGSTQVFRAGETLTATAASSYSRNEAPLSSYAWSMDEHPAGSVPEVVNNDSRSISIGLRNIVFGQYIMRATVGDAGGESSCTVTHGVVASTSSGIVIYPPGTPSATQTLIGPLMAAGKNPLEWMDFAAGESASHFESIWGLRSALASGFDRRNLWDGGQDKWGPGTVNITQSNTDLAPNNPGNKVNCSSPGTCQFFSTVCNGSGVALSNAVMFINYPAHEGGLGTTPATSTQGGYATGVPLASGETGWLVANVTSCTSNDQANINVTFGSSSYPVDIGAPKGTAFNGRNWSYSTGIPSTVLSWSTAFPSAVDFYDSGLAFYSMYYRTGLTKYLTAARFFADTHYANPMSMNKGLAYRIGNGLGAGCGGAAISSSQCNYNGEGQQQANRDLNLTSIFIRALDGKPEYWNGLRRMCGYLTASDLHVGAGDREAGYALAFVASCALADPDLMTYRPYWLSELDRGIDGYLATVCTEANEIAGRLCHGRWNGQFIYPTTGVCPEYGMRSGYSGCVGFRKPNWKARFTNGSALVTMVGATDPSLTTPSDNSKFCPASIGGPCSVPISFGPDETRGGVCVAEGAENAMTCGTSPPTTSYTPGMIITLKPPVTVDGSPAPMLNVDGQGAKAILTYSGDTAWGPKPMTADGYWALRYDGTRFVQLPILEYFYPILTTGFGYSLGTDIGRAFYWPEWTTPTTFKLKQFSTSLDRASVPDDTSWNKCNPGPTCDVEFQWDIARDIGGRAIVFHEGVILRGLTTAYEATVAAGDPDARVLSLMSDLAQWLITYGYDPQTGGLYFARNGAGCEPASAYGAMEPSSGDVACQSDINGSRLLTGEIVGGLVGTYMRETNSTKRTAIRTWMQKVMGKAFGKIDYECGPGYVEHCHDGYYMKALEETYTPGTQQYEVDKYLGFVLGFGGDMGWPSIELHTEFPRAPIPRTSSIGFKLNSIAGAATVRVSLKDQFGNVTTTDCSASPCAVPLADSSAGNLQFMLTYRNASGATLAPGQWQTLQASP